MASAEKYEQWLAANSEADNPELYARVQTALADARKIESGELPEPVGAGGGAGIYEEPVEEPMPVPVKDGETDIAGVGGALTRGLGPTMAAGLTGAAAGSFIPGVGTVTGGMAGQHRTRSRGDRREERGEEPAQRPAAQAPCHLRWFCVTRFGDELLRHLHL